MKFVFFLNVILNRDVFFFLQSVVLSDAGNYTCHAYNKYNFDEAWGILIVRGKSDAMEGSICCRIPIDSHISVCFITLKFPCEGDFFSP